MGLAARNAVPGDALWGISQVLYTDHGCDFTSRHIEQVCAELIPAMKPGSRIAIHSTPETATVGQPVSHGCVRVTLAEGRWLLAHIPLGTPAYIRT